MGFWDVTKSIGKGVVYVAGEIIKEMFETTIAASQHRENYNNSDLSKEEMVDKYRKSSDRAEKGGIKASMKDKGYIE